ncbi:type II toxin-antitoxin system RelE/ParE family toxin [Breoghania sp. JC706]|uniref:type II toxin-antitoxin system RelE/ParE family toxin n=1 Tax=Breoghania sp. JC706 TaxID=3117732 RepID=UPI00300A0577
MNRFRLTAEAEEDLEEIARYSLEAWGETQTLAYIEQLYAFFSLLSETPGVGRPRPELAAGVRSMPRPPHVIFYKEWSFGIAILRVLHGSRDIDTPDFPA